MTPSQLEKACFPSMTSLLHWAGKNSTMKALTEKGLTYVFYVIKDGLYYYFENPDKDYILIATSERDLGELK